MTKALSVTQQVAHWEGLVGEPGATPREQELIDALKQAIQTAVLYQELITAADWWDAGRVSAAFSRAKARTP